ncbi:MAG: mechanosensitive ion channel family protein [Hyphomicrobiales bacterium]|nr:mechanosensitive ion channel family protein [Hyphomicrobiales bacterium]
MLFALTISFCACADSPLVAASKTQENWNELFQEVDVYIDGVRHTEDHHTSLTSRLDQLKSEARQIANQTRKEIDDQTQLLKALGDPPAEGAPPEAAEIAQRRAALNQRLTGLRATLGESEYAITRSNDLLAELSDLNRRRFIEILLQRLPPPLKQTVVSIAIPEFAQGFPRLISTPLDWYMGLGPDERRRLWFQWHLGLFVLVIICCVFLRRWLLRHFGPAADIDKPSYTRRFVATLATAAADGLLPATIFIGLYLKIKSESALISGTAANVLTNACLAITFVLLTTALSSAILRPDNPSWRVTILTPRAATRLHALVWFLAVVFAVDHFITKSAPPSAGSDEVRSFYSFVVVSLEALGIFLLTRRSVWEIAPQKDASSSTQGPTQDVVSSASDNRSATAARMAMVQRIAREAIAFVAVGAALAVAFGYARVGMFLTNNMIETAVVVTGLLLFRNVCHETLEFLLSRGKVHPIRPAQSGLGSPKMLAYSLLDPLLVLLGIYILAPIWGLARADLTRWVGDMLAGFSIGGVTISIIDLAFALIIFFLTIAITRLLRNILSERILANTKLDAGIRNSLAVGVSYVGIVLAFLLAAAVLGISLSNLAIVAGALSVGIGFGLQNIVNNFVSGLILLVERPLKVGDWVVVGDQEGYVKRINVRATEIQTFERSAVIVPNSEILSSALINWTHKDITGRVEVRVGVAYGSDTTMVRDTLMSCAESHPDVLNWPRPYVLFLDFGDSSLDFAVRAYVRDVERRLTVGSDLRFAIDQAFRERNIEIPFPQRVVHMENTAPPEVVAPHARTSVGPSAPHRSQGGQGDPSEPGEAEGTG